MAVSDTPLGQVFGQDGHFEHERAVLVLVLEDHADELLADIDLGGVLLLRARDQRDARIGEGATQVGFDLADGLLVHAYAPAAILRRNLAARGGAANLRSRSRTQPRPKCGPCSAPAP